MVQSVQVPFVQVRIPNLWQGCFHGLVLNKTRASNIIQYEQDNDRFKYIKAKILKAVLKITDPSQFHFK